MTPDLQVQRETSHSQNNLIFIIHLYSREDLLHFERRPRLISHICAVNGSELCLLLRQKSHIRAFFLLRLMGNITRQIFYSSSDLNNLTGTFPRGFYPPPQDLNVLPRPEPVEVQCRNRRDEAGM